MEKKLVLELNYHNVYYVKTDTINYYITIPKQIENTNICIELKSKMGNYDLELNDEVWVMENIKNTFSNIDNYNITLVLPILKEEQISILEKIDNSKYDEIDKLLGQVINSSYTVLTEHKKKVNPQVILINNDRYKTFVIWFTTRYQNRILCKELIELIQYYDVNATTYKKLETPVMNFVVGSYDNEVDAPRIEIKDIPKEDKTEIQKQPTLQFSAGYATYWILAAVTLVVSVVVAIVAFIM